jgi:hypothetical protein
MLVATGSFGAGGGGAPRPAGAASVAIAVFPVEPRCSYVDTWLAPRPGGRQHLGVDIIANAGAKVYAPNDGVVTKLTYDSPAVRSGNAMRFTRADGTYFFMGHFSSFAPGIAVGKHYRAGEVIAYVGRTGNTTVNHLHFEVHPGGGAAVNPTPIVRAVDRCSSSPPPPPPPTVPPTTVPPPTVPPTTVPPTTVPPPTVPPPTVPTTVPPTTVPPTVPPTTVPSPGSGSYVPSRITAVGPARVVDTRFGRHPVPATSGTTAYPITGGTVPADATAVQLTVWASGSGGNGYVAVVPCDLTAATGTATVLTSTQRTTGASVWTPVVGGRVCVRTNVATQLTIDVHAYSSPRSTLGATVTHPVRVFDSAWAGKLLRAGTPRTLRVAGAAGMPASASAATLTLTTAGSAVTGTVQAYPCGGSPSGVPVAVIARAASSMSFTVPVAADGSVCLVSTVDVSVTLDVVTAWVSNGAALRPLPPLRLFDSRTAGAGRLVARSASALQAAGTARIPADARAVAVNVFVINAAKDTTVVVQPCGGPATTAVMVTAVAGSSSSGSGTVTLGNGRLCITASASVHVVVDVTASA